MSYYQSFSNEEIFARVYMMLAQHEEYFQVKLTPEEAKAYLMDRVRDIINPRDR